MRPASITTRRVGYNETVGFRAGTSQVFAPIGTKHLLELPLHIQDTSLLYPGPHALLARTRRWP